MMIRTRLKLLAICTIVFVALAAAITLIEYLVLQKQQSSADSVEHIQAEAVNLNILTIDILHDAHISIQPRQWRIIYSNLGYAITHSALQDQATYPFLKSQHQKIGQRFNLYIQAHTVCQKIIKTAKAKNECKILNRLRTQVRLAQQDLLLEIRKIYERLSIKSRQQNQISGMLLLGLPALMSIFILPLVLPITRSLGEGISNIVTASKRFSRGDFGFRLKVDTQDEMGILADTYNKMAQRREEAEKQLHQTERVLSHTQKMDAIGQLSGGIAHDFNNILSIIMGNLELLKLQMPQDEKSATRIDTIMKSSQRAANLTKQLLSFSRTNAESVTATDINRVISNMEDLITHSITPQVEVKNHLAEDLWLTAIDSGDFQDALVNLILNARDAMNGRGSLTIETKNSTLDAAYCSVNPNVKPGYYVQMAVSDNGDGITYENQERIFEPFFTTKEHDKGTGLGLPMVFGFISRSGGHIKVYSEPGIGTTFRLYLPKISGEINTVTQSNKPAMPSTRGSETLLVVDDEADLLELAKESLLEQGYQVITANGALQALEILAEEPTINLLFSDVVMPGGINGYELAEKVSAKYPEVKILLTSGFTEKAVAQNGLAKFDTDLLSKPYSQEGLLQNIRSKLDEKTDT